MCSCEGMCDEDEEEEDEEDVPEVVMLHPSVCQTTYTVPSTHKFTLVLQVRCEPSASRNYRVRESSI